MLKIEDILNRINSVNKNVIIFILGAFFMLLFLNQCDQIKSLKTKIKETEAISLRNLNNYKASIDTIRNEKNAREESVATIQGYVFEVNKLTKENKSLIKKYNEALNIKNKTERVNSLISAELKIKDSIINTNTVLVQSLDTLKIMVNDNKEWDKYNWRRFSGEINLLRTDTVFNIINNKFSWEQGISLKAAVVETPEGTRLKITSAYPGLDFTRIENINLVDDALNRKDTKKAGWSIGIGIGYGLNLNQGQVIQVGPSIGVGLFWSPKWLRF